MLSTRVASVDGAAALLAAHAWQPPHAQALSNNDPHPKQNRIILFILNPFVRLRLVFGQYAHNLCSPYFQSNFHR